ncbi:hypothetical protein [Streptomyces sp. 7-21]|jgi:hypothetical protein|uniref:hypothetical protein n=1 Tax=Streptomyces sp. 7-21 TaxID=2802283 RepID=UPI00191D7524|nr:hypothetical protein [Streptomyces sp. 7-21]MBL1065808.1 hypothetical protein [Streptomyces sp. 7-21]
MLYQERPRWTKPFMLTCLAVYVVAVAAMGVAALPEDAGAWAAVSGIFLLPLLPLLAVPYGKHRYHAIDLTAETLRVGRERIPVRDIDPASVHAALAEASQGGGVMRNLASSANSGFTFRGRNVVDPSLPRLVGGAYAVPLGSPSTVIATRQGERLLIATRAPVALLNALASVVR